MLYMHQYQSHHAASMLLWAYVHTWPEAVTCAVSDARAVARTSA